MYRTSLVALLLCCSTVLADPAPLIIDKSVAGMAKPRHIENVHLEIPTKTDDLQGVRAAILSAMSQAKGGPWTSEDEGEGYILARMRYRENSMTLRIEFDETWVQLKYHDATNAYACEIVVADGICYQNYRDYFGFAQNLRGSIVRELRRLK